MAAYFGEKAKGKATAITHKDLYAKAFAPVEDSERMAGEVAAYSNALKTGSKVNLSSIKQMNSEGDFLNLLATLKEASPTSKNWKQVSKLVTKYLQEKLPHQHTLLSDLGFLENSDFV